MRLDEIAEALGGTILGDPSLEIDRAVHPGDATGPGDLALAMDRKLLASLSSCPARAAIVQEGAQIPDGAIDGAVTIGRSRYAMAGITRVFDKPVHADLGIHPTAVIAEGATIGENVSVGALSYIGRNAVIGAGSIVMPQATVGAEATLGSDCLLHPGARIGERVVMGDRVIVHHNASIGADGFSFVTPEPGSVESAKATGRIDATNVEIVRINSIGTVILGDDTEIGACSSIDRGTISATVIGRGTKLDDLVMIGHNVEIGENCMLCGQVGIAGSTIIGDRVVLAGQVGVADHLKIGNDVVVGGCAGVASNLSDREIYLGTPAIRKKDFVNQVLMLRRLDNLLSDVTELKKQMLGIETPAKKS